MIRTCLFVVLCLIAVAVAGPANSKKQGPTYATNCGDVKEPICAKAKNSSKERLLTFGNECVTANYNCGHSDEPFDVKSKGECIIKCVIQLKYAHIKRAQLIFTPQSKRKK